MNLKCQTSDLLCNYHHWTVKKKKKGRKNNLDTNSGLFFTYKYQKEFKLGVQVNYFKLEHLQHKTKVICFLTQSTAEFSMQREEFKP